MSSASKRVSDMNEEHPLVSESTHDFLNNER